MKDLGTRSKFVVVLLTLTTMLGCGALEAKPAVQQASGLVASSPTLDFGTVLVGNTAVRTNSIVNNTDANIVLTGAATDKTDFRITGQKLPLRLAPGEHTALQIVYSPQSRGSSEGKVVLASNSIRSSATFVLRGTAITSGRISLNPPSIRFGKVPVGKTQTQSATLSNSGSRNVTISHVAISGQGFALTEPEPSLFPLTLKPGQNTTIGIAFTPASGGVNSGTISLIGTASVTYTRRRQRRPRSLEDSGDDSSADENTPTDVALTTISTTLNVPVSGTGTGTGTGMSTGQLAVSPSSLALGSVKVGTSQTQSAMLVNSGGSNVTISQVRVSGSGFGMSGLGPLTLVPGQRKAFSVTFAPQSAGSASGSIDVTSDAPNPVVSVPVSAVATTPGALISSPSSLSFGSAQVGHLQTLPEILTNTGGSDVRVSQASVSGSGFAIGGLNLPMILPAGQSKAFSVTFNPQTGGSAGGSLSIASDASNATLAVPLTANGASVTPGVLSTSDSSLNFASVQIGSSATQSETLTNTGGSSVTITQANVSGTVFRVTGLNLPLTLSPGQSFTFGSVFAPTTGGSATGSISVVSDASNPTLTISLAGTATVSGQLAVSPATLDFGSVVVGQTKSLTSTLTASGADITVSGASLTTSEFTISGLPVTLAAGKSAPLTIKFAPQASGTATANASFTSNASNSSAVASLTGSGTAAPQHSVALSWNPGSSSTSSVVAYNVYRGTTTGGPYSKINAMNASTSYTDSSVQAGQTYFYVTTAVDGSSRESPNSNQVQAVVPSP